MTRNFHRLFGLLSFLIVAFVIVWGMMLVGSPGNERLRKFDERKLEDLRAIHAAVLNIAYNGMPWDPDKKPVNPLPVSLFETAENAVYQKLQMTDAQTGEPYEYTPTGVETYNLCATFNLTRDEPYDIFWNHPAGHHCYAIDLRKSQLVR